MKKKISIVFAVICIVILARLYCFSGPQLLERLVSYCIYPVLKIEYAMVQWIQNQVIAKRSYAELQTYCASLQIERDTLAAHNHALLAQLDFVKDIEELIAFRSRYDYLQLQCAQVILCNLTDQEQYILIDLGSRHGITTDMVAVWKNCLVGRVTTVYPLYSKVLLITDKRCNVAVYCHETGAQGIHEGINNVSQTIISHINHLERIVINDSVFSNGSGTVFPRGFLLGTVDTYKTDDLFHMITVRPAIHFYTLKYCYILK